MDETQIQSYINAALTSGLKSALGEFKSYFTEQINPINERLSQFEVATAPQPDKVPAVEATPASPETSALMERLAKMEKLEMSRQAELHQMKLDSALGTAVGKHNPMHGDMVKELLANRYGAKAVEKDGEWYLPNGSKLAEEVDSFFGSDAGMHFLSNPSGQSLGTSTTKSPAAPQKSAKDMTSDEMMADVVWS